MEKPIAVIELSSKRIRLVVGYVLDGYVQVIYNVEKKVGHIIDSGKIIDSNKIINTLSQFNLIEDAQAKLKVKISEAILVVPPLGFEMYQLKQTIGTSSEDNVVCNLDLKSVFTIIRKSTFQSSNSLIDIVPTQFELDQGRSYAYAPIGQKSSTLTVISRLHTLPSALAMDYKNALIDSNIIVKRMIVGPQGAIELLASYEEYPNDYVLVDIGSDITTVSLVGNKSLYYSTFFMWGGDSITEHIIGSFNINESDAEKYKCLYGYDNRSYNFDPLVCVTSDGEGNEFKHYLSELNKIIKTELDTFVSQVNSCIKVLLKDSTNPTADRIPMILIGGGSELAGLVPYIEHKVPSDTVKVARTKVLGARNNAFINCLGMFICYNKYPLIFDESHSKVTNLTRNPVKEN